MAKTDVAEVHIDIPPAVLALVGKFGEHVEDQDVSTVLCAALVLILQWVRLQTPDEQCEIMAMTLETCTKTAFGAADAKIDEYPLDMKTRH